MKKLFAAFLLFFSVLIIVSCGSEKETLDVAPISDYYPLQVGKSLLYRLDSTVPAPFGTSLVVRSYQAKDSIEATFTDNQGRLSYRIFRFIRDLNGTQPWRFAATYVATPTANSLEYVDNNLRFIKLVSPIRNNFSFKAHTFIDTKSNSTLYNYLDEWEYEYDNVGESYTIGNKTYANTITVFQHDETSPPVTFDPNLDVHIRTYGIEVYAKGVGLVFKEFLYTNWQKNPAPANFEDGSYGIKLTLLSN